jgi:hypothetical protein
MKTIIQTISIGVLALAANAHAAADAAWPNDIGDYVQEYRLANGDKLSLTTRNGLFFAKLGTGMRHQVRPATPGVFVAVDGSLIVEVILSKEGEASGSVKSSELPDTRLAAITPPARER